MTPAEYALLKALCAAVDRVASRETRSDVTDVLRADADGAR